MQESALAKCTKSVHLTVLSFFFFLLSTFARLFKLLFALQCLEVAGNRPRRSTLPISSLGDTCCTFLGGKAAPVADVKLQ